MRTNFHAEIGDVQSVLVSGKAILSPLFSSESSGAYHGLVRLAIPAFMKINKEVNDE